MTPTNGHTVNGYPANGRATGRGADQQSDDPGQQYQDGYQASYGGYQEVAPYAADGTDPYRDYRRPDDGVDGYRVARADGPATAGHGVARTDDGYAQQGYQTGGYPTGGYPTSGYPTAAYQAVTYGGQPGGEIAGQGYGSDVDATRMFRSAPQRRNWAPEPELDLDDNRPAVPPPPLRSAPQVQPTARERAGWAAIGAPASPGSAPPPRAKGPRLRVDWPNCKAHGLCHELLPEAVRLDEWGFPIVGNQPLPSHVIDDARRAVIACPTLALRLVD